MAKSEILVDLTKVAYIYRASDARHENFPILVYVGGLASSMEGTKAVLIEDWAKERGLGMLRFDYRGHGVSGGEFTDFGPADWINDTISVLREVSKPAILIGSSLGGWVSAGVAKVMPEMLRGFVGIASAPDFVTREFIPKLGSDDLQRVRAGQIVELPSDYPEPYRISKALLEGGESAEVLSEPLAMPFPVRLLQGLEDGSVSLETALAFAQHIQSPDLKLSLLNGEDHGFSTPRAMNAVFGAILEILENSAQNNHHQPNR